MKAWFESLGGREQLMVAAAAVVFALFLVYALVWSPLQTSHETLQTRVKAQRDTAAWMTQSAGQLQQLQHERGPGAQSLGGKSLLAMADSTARANGLGTSLKRVEPEGSNNVRVWLEDAAFDQVVKWLGVISSTYGIGIDSATMERVAGSVGKINARLTLQAPDS
ncbi:MAG TPA: type II secretion system protein M [Gammaproteobacteria bacterium]|jgi:general secretion pathway protein M|nr:type II secretion system protein M [Gammaproteobacteria bacterium]